MTAKEWIAGFATLLGVPPPTEEETTDLLRLAAEAAHASERTAAPVACWLVARAGLAPAAALELLARWQQEGRQRP
ncbi:MAG: DUF6457 domain-containing protein [Candidatus Binatia bacterium]|nr:DUF6457 domain-containing protein [Candidatus Binatia bacterium]